MLYNVCTHVYMYVYTYRIICENDFTFCENGLYDTIKQKNTKRVNNLFTVSWWTMTPADVNQDCWMPQPELKAQRFATCANSLGSQACLSPLTSDWEAIRDRNSAVCSLTLPGLSLAWHTSISICWIELIKFREKCYKSRTRV